MSSPPIQTLDDMATTVNKLLENGVASVWLVLPYFRVSSVFQKGIPPVSATSGALVDPVTGISVQSGAVFA